MPIKAPKARACYICGRQTLLPGYDNHVIQCRALFERREAQKPPKERRQVPPDPMLYMNPRGKYASADEFIAEANTAAMKSFESTLSQCRNCGRSFLPDKLVIHQRSCTPSNPARRVNDTMRQTSDMNNSSMTLDNRSVGMRRGSGIVPMQDFPEYAMLKKCPNCGRNFNEVSFDKHARVCKKVFMSKRKVYDSAKHRAEGTELASYLNYARKQQNSSTTTRSSLKNASQASALPSSKRSKWKAESQAFRQAIREAKRLGQWEQGVKSGRQKYHHPPPPISSGPSPEELGYIQCPTCKRHFNRQAGERHMQHCKDTIHKPSRLVRGSGTGGTIGTIGGSGGGGLGRTGGMIGGASRGLSRGDDDWGGRGGMESTGGGSRYDMSAPVMINRSAPLGGGRVGTLPPAPQRSHNTFSYPTPLSAPYAAQPSPRSQSRGAYSMIDERGAGAGAEGSSIAVRRSSKENILGGSSRGRVSLGGGGGGLDGNRQGQGQKQGRTLSAPRGGRRSMY